MGLRNRSFLPLLIFLIWVQTLVSVEAQSIPPSEYQVKAAFLYNFAKFVEWPTETLNGGEPFVIGILGRDPFNGFIDEAISGKSVRDRPIVVKRFSKIEEAAGAQILFISGSEGEKVGRLLKHLDRTPILTVSDLKRFAEQGGMIQLVMDENRVRFAVNLTAVERTGLKPSSQLLRLARIVPEGGSNKRIPSEAVYAGLSDDHRWKMPYESERREAPSHLKRKVFSGANR
ncbi:MAG: YfiR family protein [Nitrospirae bacterium]|nr:YfiR family protein [Candidatus Manganitrophaceae bacterium]